MDTRRLVVMVGVVALAAPLMAGTPLPVAATQGPTAATAAGVPASMCFPVTDNGDPVLKTFDFSPRVVDSRNGAQTMTFTATAADTGGPGAPTGVTGGVVRVSYDNSDSENWTLSAPLKPDGAGALKATLTILPGFKSGTRWVSMRLEDAVGNATIYRTADLEQMGLPTTFTATTTPESQAPSVRSVRLSSATIDTRRHARTLTLRIRATDDSGIATMRAWLWGSPIRATTAHPRLISGTPANGTWLGRIRVPRWQGNSIAKLAIEMTDVVGRFRLMGPKVLKAIGQPGTVRIVSREDTEAPKLRLRSVTPRSLDVRTGAHAVTVVARVTDRGSGTRRVSLSLHGPESGNGAASIDSDLRRVSGTRYDGIWKGTATLPPCQAAPGKWRVTVSASDAANGDYLSAPEALTVANDDVLRPGATLLVDTVRPAGPLTITFSEDVVGVNAENTLVHVGYNRREFAGDDPSPITGSWACRNAAAATVDCTAGPVRTAVFTPTSAMLPGTNHTLILNREHHLGLTDLAGNPYDPGSSVSFQTS
jgi:hypothetical protein